LDLGVAAFFFGVAFLAAAFLGLTVFCAAWGAVDLTTRPVLVLVRMTGAFSSTAGAYGGLAMMHLVDLQ